MSLTGIPGELSPDEWNDWYARPPHWDTGRPQPAFREQAERGAIRGRVLDVGCGTGEHVLMCAALGLDATGIDVAPAALRAAERKARERNLSARFLLRDVRTLPDLGESFDTVLDSGLLHIFTDADRAAYLDAVRAVLAPSGRYLLLCFSDRQPGEAGPRRLTRAELGAAFADGWRVDALERTVLDGGDRGDLQGWFCRATRL